MADVAFLLVSKPAYPDAAAVVAAAEALGIALEVTSEREPMGFAFGTGKHLFVMLVAAPHPDVPHMAVGATSPSPEEAAAAPAHLIVTAMGLEGDQRAIDLQMAALTACVIEGCEAVGAMLGHGVVFHKASLFADLAKLGVEHGELPAEIAVDVTAAPEPGDRMSFLTHGLARYGREDFYVTCPVRGRGALDFVFTMARWMLSDPHKHLPTGDTVGRTSEEKLLIQRVPSPTGSGETVIRLDLPS